MKMGGWTENSVKGRESTRFIFQSDILQQSTSMSSCFADKHQYQLFLEEFYGDPVEDDREKVSREEGGEEPNVHVPEKRKCSFQIF